MLGSYPIIINEKEIGTLNVNKEGLMTVFEAQCDDPGELLRISVYGECEGYLGVMMPKGEGRLHLCKRLSKASLTAFPNTIQYAGPAGQKILSKSEENSYEEPTAEIDPVCNEPECPEQGMESECDIPAVSEEKLQPQSENCEIFPEQQVLSTKCADDHSTEIAWRRGAGGALVGSLGEDRFLAVPLKSGVAPVGGNFRKQHIEGADYAVFDIKKGKII